MIFEVTPINWEDFSWKHLSLIGEEEVISLSHAKVYVFSDSVLCLGKMNQNPESNSAWREKLSWLKSSSQYRLLDTIDGEPLEFELNIFPGFTTLQLCNKVQEFMSKMSDPWEFIGRIIIMSMFSDISWRSEDNEQECNANARPRFYSCKKISTRKIVIPRSWIRKEVVFYLHWQTTRRKGQSRWIDDDQIWRKRDTQFSVPRFHCPEERSKAKEVENYQYTSALMVIRLKLFFAQLFLLISSVGTEQSQICVMNTESAKQERRDLSLLMKTPTRRSIENEWKGSHNQIVWLSFALMHGSWQRLTSDSTCWQKTLKSFHKSQSQWLVVSTLCQKMNNYLTRKARFEGAPKLGRVISHDQLRAR